MKTIKKSYLLFCFFCQAPELKIIRGFEGSKICTTEVESHVWDNLKENPAIRTDFLNRFLTKKFLISEEEAKLARYVLKEPDQDKQDDQVVGLIKSSNLSIRVIMRAKYNDGIHFMVACETKFDKVLLLIDLDIKTQVELNKLTQLIREFERGAPKMECSLDFLLSLAVKPAEMDESGPSEYDTSARIHLNALEFHHVDKIERISFYAKPIFNKELFDIVCKFCNDEALLNIIFRDRGEKEKAFFCSFDSAFTLFLAKTSGCPLDFLKFEHPPLQIQINPVMAEMLNCLVRESVSHDVFTGSLRPFVCPEGIPYRDPSPAQKEALCKALRDWYT